MIFEKPSEKVHHDRALDKSLRRQLGLVQVGPFLRQTSASDLDWRADRIMMKGRQKLPLHREGIRDDHQAENQQQVQDKVVG